MSLKDNPEFKEFIRKLKEELKFINFTGLVKKNKEFEEMVNLRIDKLAGEKLI